MAYSYETSSVKTINGEVSGLADVVARQAIANLPTLSGGEGIQIVNEDGKNRIDLGLSAGSNMSLVYDQETNTIRLDAEGGGNYTGVSPIVVDNNEQIISADVWDFSAGNGLKFTDDNVNKVTKLEVDGNDLYSGEGIIISSNDNNQTRILLDQEWLNNQVNLSNYYKKTETSSKTELTNAFNNLNIDGLNMSASTNIDMFESGGYIVISANGGNSFPITGTNGTTGFTANMDCSSMYLSTGAGPAGAIVNFDTKGVHFEAYPSTDVSASWFNLITQYNNATCSSVKLTTAASENWFYTSALPNLNKITFIAPTYGPYETYSALIDDGTTTFVSEVDSGCCRTVVRCWNDDRNKNCWCGLNQETYFYIG